jgi:hypothetical protein
MQPKSYFGTSPNVGSPVVADVDGDGEVDILVPVNTEIAVISRTGVQLTDPGPPGNDPRVTYYTETAVSGAVVTDLDRDGILDVIAASGAPFPTPTDAAVHVWNPAAVGAAPWPAFRRDPQRRAYGPPTAAPGAGSKLFTVTPCRLLDTRAGSSLPAGGTTVLGVAARCGVSPGAAAVAVNVTIVGPGTGGNLRLFPDGIPAPLASTINFRAGQVRANNAILALSAFGDLRILCEIPAGSANVILDVTGYFE